MTHEEKSELLGELNEEAVIYHGMEDALVGYIERFGMDPVAVYDYDLVIECLTEDGDEEAALEWYGYNTLGTWAGEGTPAFIHYFEEATCQRCRKEKGLLKRIGTWFTEIPLRFGKWLVKVGK